jgi:hypothetical protein
MSGFSLSQASQASVVRALSALGGSGPLPVVVAVDLSRKVPSRCAWNPSRIAGATEAHAPGRRVH